MPRQKVPRRRYEDLRCEEVAPVLAAYPEPTLGAPYRWWAATCLYALVRPGEAAGLWKDDVDQEA